MNEININNVTFPTPISDISKLEKNNNLRINVYGYDSDPDKPKDKTLNTGIFVRYVSAYKYSKTVHLLPISNEHKQHYVLITNVNGLLRERTKCTSSSKFCERCLQPFSSQQRLEKHIIDCKLFNIQRTVMPEETKIEFKNIKNQLEFPVIIVADCESILVPISTPS